MAAWLDGYIDVLHNIFLLFFFAVATYFSSIGQKGITEVQEGVIKGRVMDTSSGAVFSRAIRKHLPHLILIQTCPVKNTAG